MKLFFEELKQIKNLEFINSGNKTKLHFENVSIDSRRCGKNDMFIAIEGDKFDGHDFVHEVFKKSCKCAVIQKNKVKEVLNSLPEKYRKKLVVIAKDTKQFLCELAALYRNKFPIPIIAVAGSNGKTSAKDFIAHVLSSKYNVLKTMGNFNNHIGVPLTLFKLNESYDVAVIEMGMNHFGEIEKLCNIAKPQFGLITNIGKEHLEFLKNLKGVLKAETELVDFIEQNNGIYFLNYDDKLLRNDASKRRVYTMTFGNSAKAEVRGRIQSYKDFYPEISIKYLSDTFTTKVHLTGILGFTSALMAAAVGFYFNIPASQIKKSINNFSLKTKRRNELIKKKDFWVIDDTYNSNPDSVKAAIGMLSTMKMKGEKHIVLGDMLELGSSSVKEHRNIGKLLKKSGIKFVYTTGKTSYETFKGAKGMKYNFYFKDREELKIFLKNNLHKGDIVLVKGSRGMKMEEISDAL